MSTSVARRSSMRERSPEHAIVANGSVVEAKARRLIALSAALLTYISNKGVR